MSKLVMKRIELYGALNDRTDILALLQRSGTIDITQCDVTNDARTTVGNEQSDVLQFEHLGATVKAALDILNEQTQYKPPSFSAFRSRRDMSQEEYEHIGKMLSITFRKTEKIIEASKSIALKSKNIAEIETELEILQPIMDFDLPLDYESTKTTKVFIGSLSGKVQQETLQGKFSQSLVDVSVICSSKTSTTVMVICLKSEVNDVLEVLSHMGFSKISLKTSLTPELYKKEILAQKQLLMDEIKGHKTAIEDAAIHRSDFESLIDFAALKRDANEICTKIGETKHAFFLTGYIPKIYVDELIKELDDNFSVDIDIINPGEDEEVPVGLKNNAFSAPTQGLVEMFSMPAKGDIDPTMIMSIFYYIFYGFMLSDAGYGLMLVLGSFIAIKVLKPELSGKRSLMMFFYCGLSSICWGLMFGSFFGDAVDTIARLSGHPNVHMPFLINPVKSPTELLLVGVAFGMVHIFAGLLVKGFQLIRQGKVFSAIFDAGFWIVLLIGLIIMVGKTFTAIPSRLALVGTVMAAAGGIGLVLTQGRGNKNIFMRFFGGLASLYDITGYLSDAMSYSRLMALGLATGVIGSVVNVICGMTGGGIGIVAFVIVFIFGHSLNFGINALGAYVHTLRLQYVEFFSKFYEGGTKQYKPFKGQTEYTKFSKTKE